MKNNVINNNNNTKDNNNIIVKLIKITKSNNDNINNGNCTSSATIRGHPYTRGTKLGMARDFGRNRNFT